MITINTVADLQNIANDMTADYELACDIDLSGIEWIPLGTTITQTSRLQTEFTGTFNGNGHTIKNLTINRNTSDVYNFVGLFGQLGVCTIQNLVIKNANITVSGANPCVGILAGSMYYNKATISSVSVQGTMIVTHTYNSDEYAMRGVGGLIGSLAYGQTTVITDCISNVNITINGCSNRDCYVAGFIGYGQQIELTRCYAFGDIIIGNTSDTYLEVSGMQSLCYSTTHNDCACAVNIIGASESTVMSSGRYLTSTSSFTNNNSRYYWANANVSWVTYNSSSDKTFNESDMVTLIGADNLSKYQVDNLDFANGKYLKLAIDIQSTEVSHDLTINGVTYNGVKKVIYNGHVLTKLVINDAEYIF